MGWIARSKSLGVAMVALAAMVLSACGGSGGGGGTTSTSVNRTGTITIWHNWQGSYLDAKKAVFDAYMKQYPNVTINLVHKDDIATAVTTAIQAGQGPDIVAWVDDLLGKLVKLEAIKPIDGIDGVDKSYMSDNFSSAAVAADTFDGKIYGMPETVEAITMIYNKDLVTPDKLPKTSEDLLKFAQTFQQQHAGMYGVVWNAKNDAYFNAPWVYGFGGYYVKADGTVGLTSDGTKAAFNYIASFRPYIPASVDYGVADTLFKEKKAAIIINGPWSVADYAKAGVNYGLAVLPTINGKPAQPFVGVKTLMVGATSQNPALAVDVIKWFDNKPNEIAQSLANKEIPANKVSLADSSVQALTDVKGFGAQVTNGTPLPNTPYMGALWDPVAKALEAVWTGKQSVNDALAAAQSAAQANIQQLK
ncbi:MAG TPA: extracellular solute-binding protein [Candidatus Dormibacteraeota bacterium]|nr:extracellular solute-binding protein [Candidatus Dormibacteraeota bacterium]